MAVLTLDHTCARTSGRWCACTAISPIYILQPHLLYYILRPKICDYIANMKTKIIDILLLGLALWLMGYVASILLYGFVSNVILGWVLFVIFTPVAVCISFLRFRKRKEAIVYYFVVALAWMLIAIAFDYLFIVKTFGVSNYYKLDVFVYYLTTFLVPLLVGYRYGRG